MFDSNFPNFCIHMNETVDGKNQSLPSETSDLSSQVHLTTSASGDGPAVKAKRRGRQPRKYLVRKNPMGKGSRGSGVQAPIIQEHLKNGSLTEMEAEFVQDVTHPASPTFLKPGEAHKAVYVNDPVAGSPSRVERTITKPPVAQTLKALLDTPDLRSKIHAGLDTILDDVEHAKFRPREWTDALRAWADLTGNKAPDKVIAIPVDQDQRQARYEEIIAKIRREEQDASQTLITGPGATNTPKDVA